jgi:hypothetical protein
MTKSKQKPYYVSNKELQDEYIKWYDEIAEAQRLGKEEPPIPPAIVDAIVKISTKLTYSPEFINYSFREDLIGDAQYDCVRFAKKYNPNKILHKAILTPLTGTIQVKDELVGEQSKLTGKVKYKNGKTGLVSLNMDKGIDFSVGEIVRSKNGSAIVEKIETHTANNPFSYITTISYNAFLRRIDDEKIESYVKAKILSETPIHEFYDSIDSDDVDIMTHLSDFIAEHSCNLINNEPMALKRKRKKLAKIISMDELENSIQSFCGDSNE